MMVKDREGVDTNKIRLPRRGVPNGGELQRLQTIGTKEAGAFLQGFWTDVRHHAAHASRVEKELGRKTVDSHILDLDLSQSSVVNESSPAKLKFAGEHLGYFFEKFQSFKVEGMSSLRYRAEI